MKRIERHNYLQKLIAFKDKKLIKVITGIRRCGKSTIMEIYRDWLIAHGVMQEQIIYLNFEDYDYFELRDPRKLYSYVKPLIQEDKMTYIFFDEIQHVTDFPDIRANDEVVLFGRQGAEQVKQSDLEDYNGALLADVYTMWGNSNPKVAVR